MSRVHVMILLGLVGSGLAMVAAGKQATGGSEFLELHRVEIGDASRLEVVMGLITNPPESMGAKHYHPGGELGFILDGTVTFATEKGTPLTLEAGASFYQPPGEWHAVSTAAKGSKTVVFRVLEKGQPMIVPID